MSAPAEQGGTGMTADEPIKVSVRWFDGYMEEFEATEVRFGIALLWMRLTNGRNRHIPVGPMSVRWYSVTPESHERITYDEGAQS